MFSQTRLILVREKSENLKFLKSGRPAFSQSSNLDVSLGSDIPGYAGIRSPFFILTVKLRNSFFLLRSAKEVVNFLLFSGSDFPKKSPFPPIDVCLKCLRSLYQSYMNKSEKGVYFF